jgi:RNA polymerase sigma-70 factor (ECF subfamily)
VAEELLVLRAQAGCRDSLGRLLQLCQPDLLRYIARQIGAGGAGSDIWQDSVIAAMKGLHGLQDPARFRPWLYRIATHKCRDWQRRRARESKRAAATEPDSLPAAFNVEPDAKQAVRHTLHRLPPDERRLLAMFYRDGLSVRDIAMALDIRPGAVRTRLFRARQRFRTYWQGDNDEQN